MGPIEITFFVMVAIWALIGVIRGYNRELGITTMLLIALFVLVFTTGPMGHKFQAFLAFVAGPDPERLAPVAHRFSGPPDPNPKAGVLSR